MKNSYPFLQTFKLVECYCPPRLKKNGERRYSCALRNLLYHLLLEKQPTLFPPSRDFDPSKICLSSSHHRPKMYRRQHINRAT